MTNLSLYHMHFPLFTSSTTTRPQAQDPDSKTKMNFGTAASSSSKEPKRTTKETHPNLPPGLILDAEGKVCKVCNSWQDWGKMKVKKKTGERQGEGGSTKMKSLGGFGTMAGLAGSSTTGSSANLSSSTTNTSISPADPRRDCPADTAALGRSTWTFLHTTAAYYPVSAPIETQKQMTNLLSSLSLLYPCVPCADDFQEKVKENPPDVSGRYGLSRWLCERHNEVNEKLGKEVFGCDWGSLDKRWKGGPEDGSCD
jgi:FAD-linked sulfhydryl oxidase